ncbi:5380_t:CDS:2, partial [Racocetra fulgida]
QGLLMDLDSLLISNEFLQSNSEPSDIDKLSNKYKVSNNYEANNYEVSDNHETMDNKYLNNKLAELASYPDVLEILRFQDLREFFSLSSIQENLSHKRYPCSGLYGEKHLKYIERIGGFTLFGGAPPVKKLAQELFLLKFIEKTKFSYSKLRSNQSKRLNNELSARSKWKIDQKCLCICSSECETYTDQIGRVCAKCFLLTKDQVFKNALSKLISNPENRHYTPKSYFKGKPLLKFLGNLDIKDLWTSVSYSNENNTVLFWLKLAEKGVQNMKYSEEITNFIAILSSLSLKAYDFF